ncbi:MAG: deoxyribodipyrimidine photo-lyase [Planctomycetota bacterium]|nr:deoxyribodipyrimidine photo-lyase [Planctomycetota bacterium]
MRTLVWFRSDLRVEDNTALWHAARVRGGVVGVFVVSPGEWRSHEYAPVKVGFILRTLRELSASLAALQIPLLVAHAPTPADIPGVLLEVAAGRGCGALAFNREYELNERRRDERVREAFAARGLRVDAYDDQVFAPPGEVRTGDDRYFSVFTPFKKALYARMQRIGLPEVRGTPARQPEMPCPSHDVPERIAGFESTVDPALWPAGESHARARLAHFAAESIRPYKDRRDYPGEDGTSILSPYLAVGAISSRQCLAAAIDANRGARSPLDSGLAGPVHWISELVWREFYIHIMVGFPRVCMHRAFQPATERIRWADNPAHLHAWQRGRTGVPIVDAGMRQLLTTGWMHNRVRMIAAMFFTKNLFLDWRLGESWFMRHLIDGFLASNNGGWQWSASTGTDAAPYFRIFNPVSQSRKFDPDGAYIRRYVPELAGLDAKSIHEPWTIPGLLRAGVEYPDPLVDLGASRERAIEAFREIKGTPALREAQGAREATDAA